MKKQRKILAIFTVMLLVIAIVFIALGINKANQKLTKINGFAPNSICQAITPECGVCFGEVIEDSCYVDKSKLDEFQLNAMGF